MNDFWVGVGVQEADMSLERGTVARFTWLLIDASSKGRSSVLKADLELGVLVE